jgi:CRP-like cAMP-binding protein
MGKYRKGQVIFSQGDAGDAVFYVHRGKVKVTVVSEQGKEAVVAILGTDEFFGEGCLAGQALRISTVTTMTDSVIARIEKATITRVIHQEPMFAEMFIAHLLGRTIRVEADLVDQLFNSSEKRLARMLLLLANFGKEGTPEPMIAKISQETLAEMIGTTRSRVSFFMNKFRKLGFIEYNGGIEVHSSLLNSFCTTSRKSRIRFSYFGIRGWRRSGGAIRRPFDVSNFAQHSPRHQALVGAKQRKI